MSKSTNTPPEIASELLGFIDKSPTPFHATLNLREMFTDAGFTHLSESEDWECLPNNGYVVTRNDSSIIAFRLADNIEDGFKMLGAHTDSPCLKIKPKPQVSKLGCQQLGVEVYGGVLLHPWLDRDLSIAGRVSGLDQQGNLASHLIDFKAPIAIIPNLAIHLDRNANQDKSINKQQHLPLIIGQREVFDFDELLLEQCTLEHGQSEHALCKVLDYELSCYDTQAASFVGLDKEFIAAARLDNLLSSYVAAKALIESNTNQNCFYVSTDHEEVGSASACGAQGPFLKSVLERLTPNATKLTQTISRSSLVSCDNAHAVHPNYADKHELNHQPILNQGPVIKINASQRYASNSISSARFQRVCEQVDVPVQQFVTRSDLACGSTIGPITASELGIETLDVGAPQWAMHSIRETAGSHDIGYLHTALLAYLADEST